MTRQYEIVIKKEPRWRVLVPHGLDQNFHDLPKAQKLARQYDGALIQERYGKYIFSRYYSVNGRLVKTD